MQLKWIQTTGGRYFDTKVFDTDYSVTLSPLEEWKIVKSLTALVEDGFKTKEEAMVAAHQIIEKELEKGYIGKADIGNNGISAKLSYIPKDMLGYKKALALFTNKNGDEYIDAVLVSATIPKGSLVREVDPENHNDLPYNGICRKCRSDRAIIVDILPPMCLRPGESTNLPSRKTQRKKISIISMFVVMQALRRHLSLQETYRIFRGSSMKECTIARKIIDGCLRTICGFDYKSYAFCKLFSQITQPQFPMSPDLAVAKLILDPYKDVLERYQDDPCMLCKVLLARIISVTVGMDLILEQSYKIGDKIQIDDFDLKNRCCGEGFHFFKTAEEAWNYNFN